MPVAVHRLIVPKVDLEIMADVRFSVVHDSDVAPTTMWQELIDWKGHEKWVPSTYVEVHSTGGAFGIGDTFTAWTGPAPTTKIGQRLSLEDRMRVDERNFDAATSSGNCLVTKLGPLLSGTASFTVAPHGGGSRVVWNERVAVKYAPQLLAPLLGRIGAIGFRLSLARLSKLLRSG